MQQAFSVEPKDKYMFLPGVMNLFDLPQLYQAVRQFNPQATVEIHWKGSAEEKT